MGETGGHCHWGKPVRRAVRTRDRAAALYARSAHDAKLRRAGRGTDARLASRFRGPALYLAEGAAGLPVFNPGMGGIAQIIGPTGGFLMAYPLVAFVAGWIYERTSRRFGWAALAGFAGEVVLFAGGLSWLFVLTHSLSQAVRWGLYWFVFAEVIKIMLAAGVAGRWSRQDDLTRQRTALGCHAESWSLASLCKEA